ncbi:prolyl oligopeptidase family serine peptidase [Sphingomonas sp. LY54]|uniref:S9 family peptidase n=1 Tax=Sphingomonas sp. LY54 TaxID=3095343 RepID=UPI002D78F54B|nr:prolyl oligopeptidase family serine peptidase [Sphingomonas sp. LY54]WRP28965.1 prolyl oligopeptidase family serine peptidase [Sphingomonas sp. LY54]
MRSAVLALLLATAAPAIAQNAPVETRQVGTATLENVPAIPAEVKAAVQRYQNYREATFRDWLPDGSMLITTRFGTTNQVHRVAAPGAARTQLTFFDEPVGGVSTIPGSDRFVVTRDTGGDEWFQLYAMGLTGEPVALTEPGTRNQGTVFSKDGSLMAWSRAIKGSPDYAIFTADPSSPGSRKLAYQGTGAIQAADIAPDKSRILLARNLSNRVTRLSLLDLATGEAREIAFTAKPARYEEARFTPDGKGIIVITDADADNRRLVEIDLTSGKRTVLAPDLKWDVETFKLSPDGRVLAYAVNEDGFSKVVLQDRVTRRALPQPQLPRGVLTGLEFSPDGSKLAVSLSTATSAGDVWSWDVAGGQLVRWTESELGGLDTKSLAEPKLIRFKSFDGLSVPAFVYRPTNVPAGAKTPVVMDIHGGPESQTRPGWNPGAQYMANMLGATVILPNVRGSDGYGTKYLNLDNGPKREDSVKDIGALLDWIAAQPDLDKDKVAVYGQSYGGYMSLAVMTHYADRLVGGVERYGISDFITFLNNTEAYRRDNRRAEYGDERDPKMRAVFERINPLANVHKITKPILVMQGANDPRVPKSESDQVVAKIRQNGVDAWYVVYADEGHGFLKKHNNDLRREVETVFLRRLFGSQ